MQVYHPDVQKVIVFFHGITRGLAIRASRSHFETSLMTKAECGLSAKELGGDIRTHSRERSLLKVMFGKLPAMDEPKLCRCRAPGPSKVAPGPFVQDA